MGNFYTDVIKKDARFTSTASCRDMALLEPAFRQKVMDLMAASSAAGTPLMVTETYRSSQRQTMLFNQGATQLKTVGVHHYGLACDFAKVVGGEPSWGGSWTFMQALCAAQGIVWGGDWGTPSQPHTFHDWDHVQGCTVAQQAVLFAGTWYPSA